MFIDDVVDAYFNAAFADDVNGETIHLGSGALVAIRGVVEQIATVIQAKAEPNFGALPDRPAETEIVADTSKAARLLNWSAATPLEVGLRKTIDSAREAAGR